MKPLTPAMWKLLEEMQAGARVHYMPYTGRFNEHAYYFSSADMGRCTQAARGLRKRKLAEPSDADWRGHKLRLTHAGLVLKNAAK